MYKREILQTTKTNMIPILSKGMRVYESECGDLYYYGGVKDNNPNQSVYVFLKNENRFIKLDDIPISSQDVCVYTVANTIFLIVDGIKYTYNDKRWIKTGTTGISNAVSISRDGNTYIIDYNHVYSVTNKNSYSRILSNKELDPRKLLYSDKNIEFTNGKIYIGEWRFEQHTPIKSNSMIINDTIIESPSDALEYVTSDSMIYRLDKSGNMFYKYGVDDNYNILRYSSSSHLYQAHELIELKNDNLYITYNSGSVNQIQSLNIRSLESSVEVSYKVSNKSFSQRVLYNHPVPKAIILDEPMLVGTYGFYSDNSMIDNSFYFKNSVTEFSLDLHNPSLCKINNNICFLHKNDETYQVHVVEPHSGEIKSTISINIDDDNLRVYHNDREFIYYTPCGHIHIGNTHHTPLPITYNQLCMSGYYHYILTQNKNGNYDLISRANYSGIHKTYTLNIEIDNIIDFKVFNNNMYLLYELNNDTVLEKVYING